MRTALIFLLALIGVSSLSNATAINVNIVGWPFVTPAFDTTIVAAPGDTLYVFNSTTGFMGFNKEVNNVRVDTLPGVFQGDTVDIHVLGWNHLTVGYYIETQVWNEYGLRCHFSFLNTSVAAAESDFSMALTPMALNCFSKSSGTLKMYSMNGTLVLSERLTSGSNCFHLYETAAILIAEVRFDDGHVISQKVYCSGH